MPALLILLLWLFFQSCQSAPTCNAAPPSFCSLIRRSSCTQQSETGGNCGNCLSGYSGPSGPSNVPCQSIDAKDTTYIQIITLYSSENDESQKTDNNIANDDNMKFGEMRLWHAWRFPQVTIPMGATLNDSFIQFWAAESDSGTPTVTLRFRVELPTNGTSMNFTQSKEELTSRVSKLSSDFVDWQITQSWSSGVLSDATKSPNLNKPLLQLFNSGSWKNGFPVAIFAQNNLPNSWNNNRERRAISYDKDSRRAAFLYLKWDVTNSFFQDKSSGYVSMEAEHAQSHQTGGDTNRNWYYITNTSNSGYSGGMATQSNNQSGVYWTASSSWHRSPRYYFFINFQFTGDHYIWLRTRIWNAGSSQPLGWYIALDNTRVNVPSTTNVAYLAPPSKNVFMWTNRRVDSSNGNTARFSVSVGSLGIHRLEIWLMGLGCVLDKVVIAKLERTNPIGNSGPASPRMVNYNWEYYREISTSSSNTLVTTYDVDIFEYGISNVVDITIFDTSSGTFSAVPSDFGSVGGSSVKFTITCTSGCSNGWNYWPWVYFRVVPRTSMPCNSAPGAVGTVEGVNSGNCTTPLTVGLSCKLSCNAGYTESGSLTVTCQSSATFSTLTGKCNGILCNSLSSPTNGAVSTSNNGRYPSNATYTCNTGYVLSGSTTRTCQTNGDWTASAPSCEGAPCGPPPAAIAPTLFISSNNSNKYPSQATYGCQAGFITSDPVVLYCAINGGSVGWVGTPPVCKGTTFASSTNLYAGGRTGYLEIKFPPPSNIPSGTQIILTLPAGYVIDNTSSTLNNGGNQVLIPTTSTVSVLNSTSILIVPTATLSAFQNITFSLDGLYNPSVPGQTASFRLQIAGVLDSAADGVVIKNSYYVVFGANFVGRPAGGFSINFTPTKVLNPGDQVLVKFPNEFDFFGCKSNGTTLTIATNTLNTLNGVDGSTATCFSDNRVVIQVNKIISANTILNATILTDNHGAAPFKDAIVNPMMPNQVTAGSYRTGNFNISTPTENFAPYQLTMRGDVGSFWSVYPGNADNYPNFDALTPTAYGQTGAINLSASTIGTTNIAMRFITFIAIPSAGTYKYIVTGEPKARFLWSGGSAQSGVTVSVDYTQAGRYFFLVEYTGGSSAANSLKMEMKGPSDTTNIIIPSSYLYNQLETILITSVTGCQDEPPATINCLATSSTKITIVGNGFKNGTSPNTVYIGPYQCTNPVVMSLTQLTCTLPIVTNGGSYRVKVMGPLSQGWSSQPLVSFYPAPVITPGSLRVVGGAPGNSLSVVGGETIEFNGKNFGLVPTDLAVQVGLPVAGSWAWPYSRTCAVDTASKNSTYVKCTLPAGSGKNLLFSVKVGSLISEASTFTLTYPAPWLNDSSIRFQSKGPAPILYGRLTQGELIIIEGTGFGDMSQPVTSRVRVTYGPAGNVGAYDCEVDPTSNTTYILCRTARGTGEDNMFRVSTPNIPQMAAQNMIQYSSISTTLYNYPPDVPEIYEVEGCPINANNATSMCPTDAILNDQVIEITIHGKNFAFESYLIVNVGGQECANPNVIDNFTLTCDLPMGKGRNAGVNIIRDDLFSGSAQLVSYAPPTIINVQGTDCLQRASGALYDCPREGNVWITIVGDNFGHDAARVLVSGVACDSVTHLSGEEHTKLKCLLPPGTGLEQSVIVIQLGLTSPSFSISYKQCSPGQFAPPYVVACSNCSMGSFTSSPGQTACSVCSPSTYGPTVGASSCLACPPGSYSDEKGATACTPCPVGKSSFGGAQSCSACLPGFYAAEISSKQCIACPKGRFAENTSAFECSACPTGRFQNSIASFGCQLCDPGFYANETGSSSCEFCPPGTNSSQQEQSACSLCESGKFSPTTGYKTCSICNAGSFSQRGASSCTMCDPGKYQNQPGENFCKPCAAGRYTKMYGAKECLVCEAGKFSGVNATACEDCSPGYFSASEAASCTLCPSGTVQEQKAQTSCSACFRGFYSVPETPSLCYPCPPGTYNSNDKQTACLNCTAGTFSRSPGTTGCQLCQKGTFNSLPGQSICNQCVEGNYSESDGSTACSLCPAGKHIAANASSVCLPCNPGYASKSGAAACDPCPMGSQTNLTGSIECSLCPPGYSKSVTGVGTCTSCESGTFASGFGSAICAKCQNGTYSVKGATACQNCSAGKYFPAEGGSDCFDCPAGSYSDEDAADGCKDCPLGSYNPISGQSMCNECPHGKFSNSEKSTDCSPCPRGSFAQSAGTNQCQKCPFDTYADEEGSITCKQCPPGQYQTAQGQTICLQCGQNKYLAAGKNNSLNCESCPRGAYCSYGDIVSLQGNYLFRDETTGLALTRTCPKSYCLDNGQCAAHRKNYSENPLCGSCIDNYFEWSGQCYYCEKGSNFGLIALFMILSWIWVCAFHTFSQSPHGDVKIFFYFVQIVLVIFGPEIDDIFQWLNVFDFSIFDVGISACLGRLTAYEYVQLHMLIPFICIGQLLSVALAHFLFLFIRAKRKPGESIPFDWYYPYIRSTIALLVMTYAANAKATISVFNCDEVAGYNYMVASPAIDCNSSAYQELRSLAIFYLLFSVILIPCAMFGFLFLAWDKGWMQDPRWAPCFGILTDSYTPIRWWWDVCTTIRRTVIISIAVSVNQRENMKTALAICNLCFLAFHLRMRPFSIKIENFLEAISLSLLSLVAVILIVVGQPPLTSGARVLLIFLVIIPIILSFFYMCYVRYLTLTGRKGIAIFNKRKDHRRRISIVRDTVAEHHSKMEAQSRLGAASKFDLGEPTTPRPDKSPSIIQELSHTPIKRQMSQVERDPQTPKPPREESHYSRQMSQVERDPQTPKPPREESLHSVSNSNKDDFQLGVL